MVNITEWNSRVVAPLDITEGFGPLGQKYFESLAIRQYSARTIDAKCNSLKRFAAFCDIRDIQRPEQVDKTIASRYQKHLHHYRKEDGMALSANTQRYLVGDVRGFFTWLNDEGYLLFNPFASLVLPKVPVRLPKGIMNVDEVEKVMKQPNLDTIQGIRDRAMLEVFYSTGIRRSELLALQLLDLDRVRGLIAINQGKGAKDRIVPIGERALFWVDRYLIDARPELVRNVAEQALFITERGGPLSTSHITKRFGEYIKAANINKSGACHVFRHSTATLMLECGADIRHIQALLGHESLSTTQIYTQVAIQHLKEVHQRTHPGERKQAVSAQ